MSGEYEPPQLTAPAAAKTRYAQRKARRRPMMRTYDLVDAYVKAKGKPGSAFHLRDMSHITRLPMQTIKEAFKSNKLLEITAISERRSLRGELEKHLLTNSLRGAAVLLPKGIDSLEKKRRFTPKEFLSVATAIKTMSTGSIELAGDRMPNAAPAQQINIQLVTETLNLQKWIADELAKRAAAGEEIPAHAQTAITTFGNGRTDPVVDVAAEALPVTGVDGHQ